jgi:carbon-monoxide dehydrogenase large subunit
LLGIDPKDVRVIVGDVGGGFGMKTGPYPEDLVVAYCSKHLQCPVKWIADRGEDFLSSSHGRNIHTHAQMALDNNGKILALCVHSLANVGAYPSMTGLAIQLMIGPWVQTSVYDIGLIDFQFKTVLTNTMNTGAYRGAGRPEAIYNIERLMDEAARQIGMDRIELRRINFVQLSQMPYRNPMGQTYDVGQFEAVMNSGLELSQWNSFESRAAQSAKKGLWRGLGVSTFLEWTGGNALEESVQVRILPDGTIEVFSAVIAMGQGIATSLAQLVVDIFDVPLSQIKIVLGDTDRGNGFGSAGSRSLFTGGSAVSMGAQQTLEKARELAAKDLEVSPQDLRYENAKFVVPGTDLQRTLGQIAATQPNQTIEVDSKTTSSGPTWPNGCHVCEVEIDPQTGEVTLDRYSSVNDVGRVVNPTIVRGQLDGGAIQGIGQALCENMVYDEQSGQLLTGSLMDYAVPRADILPKQMLTEMDERTPSTNNVLGVKGVGELGTIGATPCVVNAIADALARNGRAQACKQLQMPLTSEKIWSLINWH